jgi:hypothetical protein
VIIKLQLATVARDGNKSAPPLAIALGMLVRAYQYAKDTDVDRWDFAIPIGEFRYAGVTISELRWLLFSGIAIHAKEIALGNGHFRRYVRLGVRCLPPDACFVLSDFGVKSVAEMQGGASLNAPRSADPRNDIQPLGSILNQLSTKDSAPRWDAQRKELQFKGMLVKQFRTSACNQEWIIRAFHEEEWPTRIDDPLPPLPDRDSKRRLSDTIKCLNRHQVHELILFRGDGSGSGVLWEPRTGSPDDRVNGKT